MENSGTFQSTEQQPAQPDNVSNQAQPGATKDGSNAAAAASSGAAIGGSAAGMGGWFQQGSNVPLLVGATPFQQQLSALGGFGGGGHAPGQPPFGGFPQLQTDNFAAQQPQIQQLQQLQHANQMQFQQQQQFQQAQQIQLQQQQLQQQQRQLQQQSQQQQQQVAPQHHHLQQLQLHQQAMLQQQQQQAPFMQQGIPGVQSSQLGLNLQQLQQLQFAQQLGGSLGGVGNLGNPLGGLGAGTAGLMNPKLAALAGAGLPGGGVRPPAASPAMAATPAAANSNMGLMGDLNGAAAASGPFGNAAAAPDALGASSNSASASNNAQAPAEMEWAEPFAGKGKKEPPFPLKLHQILSNPEFQEFICWNPHGRSWRILKPPLFEQVVIPLYFRHAKYASFMRQVNGWGFKRIVSGNDHNSYYHELFVRDCPQLCLKMKRIKKGELVSKKKSDEEEEASDVAEEASLRDEATDGAAGVASGHFAAGAAKILSANDTKSPLGGSRQQALTSQAHPAGPLSGLQQANALQGLHAQGLSGQMASLQGILGQNQNVHQALMGQHSNLQGLLGQAHGSQVTGLQGLGLNGQASGLQGLAGGFNGHGGGMQALTGGAKNGAVQGLPGGLSGQPGALHGLSGGLNQHGAGIPGISGSLGGQGGLQGLSGAHSGVLQGLGAGFGGQPQGLQGLPGTLNAQQTSLQGLGGLNAQQSGLQGLSTSLGQQSNLQGLTGGLNAHEAALQQGLAGGLNGQQASLQGLANGQQGGLQGISVAAGPSSPQANLQGLMGGLDGQKSGLGSSVLGAQQGLAEAPSGQQPSLQGSPAGLSHQQGVSADAPNAAAQEQKGDNPAQGLSGFAGRTSAFQNIPAPGNAATIKSGKDGTDGAEPPQDTSVVAPAAGARNETTPTDSTPNEAAQPDAKLKADSSASAGNADSRPRREGGESNDAATGDVPSTTSGPQLQPAVPTQIPQASSGTRQRGETEAGQPSVMAAAPSEPAVKDQHPAPVPAGMLPPLSGLQTVASGLSSMDSSTLLKLQEALTGAQGSVLQLPGQIQAGQVASSQQHPNSLLSPSLNPPNLGAPGGLGFLASHLNNQNTALLAAQLQAATQPSATRNDVSSQAQLAGQNTALLAAQLQASSRQAAGGGQKATGDSQSSQNGHNHEVGAGQLETPIQPQPNHDETSAATRPEHGKPTALQTGQLQATQSPKNNKQGDPAAKSIPSSQQPQTASQEAKAHNNNENADDAISV